jgi:hypothetical protein
MIIWPENSRSPSPLLWKTGAGSYAEKVNATSWEKRKGESGLPARESISKQSNLVGTVRPDNVSIGRSVAHTWLDLSARDYSNVGVNAAGSNATIITLGW